MVPLDLKDFLIACLGASASFIGLLFVGLSVVLQKAGNQKLADTERVLAESSYSSLINIFFVSLVGILPGGGIGWVCLVMAVIGLISCWHLKGYSHSVSVVISSIIFITELIFALNILSHPSHSVNIGWFEAIIIALFASSLFRAWGLTGIREDSHKKS